MSKLDKIFELYFGDCEHIPTAIKDEAKREIRGLIVQLFVEAEGIEHTFIKSVKEL